MSNYSPLIDPHGRHITYIRVSVTDLCDFRCVYCMSESMTFLPKSEVLSLEELDRVCSAFIKRGVRKLRLTGGEPLVRRNILVLIESLGRHLKSGGLDELTMTTNATMLAKYAGSLYENGVRRINISLDTLDPVRFNSITRRDKLAKVLGGITAAKEAGLKIKINTVVLGNHNGGSLDDMIAWCGEQGFDLTLIETMPLGDIGGERADQYLPLSTVRAKLEKSWSLTDLDDRTDGPARYVRVAETGRRIGFITPLSHNFCDSCNRVRLTCTGKLYLCLGQDDSADLREPMRNSDDDGPLMAAIDNAIARKPKGHEFTIESEGNGPVLARHMNTTGG